MIDWIKDHQALLWWLSVASVVVLVASIFIIPAVVARLQADYFAHDERPDRAWKHLPQPVRIAIHIGKNILGAILLVAGLAMLMLPGPGLVTAAVGFFLIDMPGKYRFERWLVERPAIRRSINWIRHRAGQSPLTKRKHAST